MSDLTPTNAKRKKIVAAIEARPLASKTDAEIDAYVNGLASLADVKPMLKELAKTERDLMLIVAEIIRHV